MIFRPLKVTWIFSSFPIASCFCVAPNSAALSLTARCFLPSYRAGFGVDSGIFGGFIDGGMQKLGWIFRRRG